MGSKFCCGVAELADASLFNGGKGHNMKSVKFGFDGIYPSPKSEIAGNGKHLSVEAVSVQ